MTARRSGMGPCELRMENLKVLGAPFIPGESGTDSDLVEGLDLWPPNSATTKGAPGRTVAWS